MMAERCQEISIVSFPRLHDRAADRHDHVMNKCLTALTMPAFYLDANPRPDGRAILGDLDNVPLELLAVGTPDRRSRLIGKAIRAF